MLKFLRKPIDLVFTLHLALLFLIATETISRNYAWLILILVCGFIVVRPLKEALLLFSRSIPFYIALPITSGFDSFNIWRVVVILIFIKWLYIFRPEAVRFLKSKIDKKTIYSIYNNNKIEFLGALMFAIAFISLGKSAYLTVSIKRLIYFINLSIIFPVIVWAIKDRIITIAEFIKNIALSIILVAGIGFLQLLSVYYLNINEFMIYWAGQVQNAFYGSGWRNIVFSGNTWFSYNTGTFPKLRMFSTFPDSHTFPLYLLFGASALITYFYAKIKENEVKIKNDRSKTIASNIYLIILFFIFLAIVLSGTRGIWISVVFPVLFILITTIYPKFFSYVKLIGPRPDIENKISKKSNVIIALFFLAFAASYIIMAKDQFNMQTQADEQKGVILQRVISIMDVSETSNNLRIEIWKKTLQSVASDPLFGVGIGNFPVILNQNISALKAGASAHNLYLNILAETGIFSLIVYLAICLLILKYSWDIFIYSDNEKNKIYGYCFFLYSLWIFGYNLTDAALFDEREFLMFILTTGIVVGFKKQLDIKSQKYAE